MTHPHQEGKCCEKCHDISAMSRSVDSHRAHSPYWISCCVNRTCRCHSPKEEVQECEHPWGTSKDGYDVCGLCEARVGGNGKVSLGAMLAGSEEVQESKESDSWEEFVKKWQAKYEIHPSDLRDIAADARTLAFQEAAAIAKSGLWEYTPDTNRDKVWHYNHGREDAARDIEKLIT